MVRVVAPVWRNDRPALLATADPQLVVDWLRPRPTAAFGPVEEVLRLVGTCDTWVGTVGT